MCNMENLYGALTSVKVLRCSVGQIFSSLADGIRADHGEEGKAEKFLSEIEELLNAVTHHLRLVLPHVFVLLFRGIKKADHLVSSKAMGNPIKSYF